jgi:hypothetical protein
MNSPHLHFLTSTCRRLDLHWTILDTYLPLPAHHSLRRVGFIPIFTPPSLSVNLDLTLGAMFSLVTAHNAKILLLSVACMNNSGPIEESGER